MRKAVLEGNILPKAKQRFLVDGYTGADIIYLTRDVIEMAVGVIELADQTRVPGGRIRAGDFTVTLQFARNPDREAYLDWFEKCVDYPGTGDIGGGNGISSTYKRNATIIYYRLFKGSNEGYPSGSDSPPVVARLYGCWPSSVKVPDYDINSDDGEADCSLEVTINFDDIFVEGNQTRRRTGGYFAGSQQKVQ